MIEEWKDIKGYEGSYQVSNLGDVKSLARENSRGRNLKERILKNCIGSTGYYRVVLYKEGSSKTFKVHRLVAIAFIPNPDKKPQVNHKNGDKDFNFKINLEWVTNVENTHHAIKTGLRNDKGENSVCSLLNEAKVIEIRKSNLPQRILADMYGVSQPHIGRIKRGISWRG